MSGLGVAQLLAWGTLYYAIAVIGEPMRADLRMTESQIFGAFTLSLAISGVLAPWAGRRLDRYGGRAVLVTSGFVGALGFLVLARSHSFAGMLLGWSINGLAMALGLYDTCFAALGQVDPSRYRRAVTGVTLIAGFASTVSWPASHYLMQSLGWRALCDIYALALCFAALIYLTFLPGVHVTKSCELEAEDRQVAAAIHPAARRRARLLALTFAGASLISTSMSAHLLGVLHALKLPSEQAVWAASSIGVMQVLGRFLELGFGARQHPARVGLVTFAALSASIFLLLGISAAPWLVIAFVVLYGTSNGLLTIVKATLPVQLFGLRNAGAVLGDFSMPSLVTRAFAPLWFAVMTSKLGTHTGLLAMAAIGLATLTAYWGTTRAALHIRVPC